MPPTPAIGLTPAQFAAAFPFHLVVDPSGRLMQVGGSLARLLPPGEGDFSDRFRIVRPRIVPTFSALVDCAGKLIVLESRYEPRLQLRGSVQPMDDGAGIVFLLSPWITRLQDIEGLGLTLSDFAPHDPVVDLLFMQQANVTALDDTRRLAGKLRERTEYLDSISSLSPDGVVLFGREGRVTYANPAFGRMLGESATFFVDMTDATFSTFLSTRLDPDQAAPDFGGTPSTAAGTGRETDRRQAPRTLLHLLEPERRILSCSVRLEEGGSKVLYFRDITREAEVDRMKSEFLSTAAHELRTPMASVFGFSELLLKRDYDDKTRKDVLSTIHRQAGALIHLLNELLDLARIEARAGKDFKIERQPVRPIIENTVAALLMPNDSRRVLMNLPESLPECAVDADKLQQALTNLLSNAYKYSPNGGEIRLDVINQDGDGQFGIRVSDQGLGMTPEQLARCFERFYRADASQNIPGTGLGLALVKEIIEIFGGSVQLESRYGVGTTCTIWLPKGENHVELAA
ncbi:MAG: ATP-binding protein [Burkholderiales bacterium]